MMFLLTQNGTFDQYHAYGIEWKNSTSHRFNVLFTFPFEIRTVTLVRMKTKKIAVKKLFDKNGILFFDFYDDLSNL